MISLAAYPDQIKLDNPFAYRQVLLTGKLKTGESVDLTRLASLESNPSVVSVSDDGLVRPLANGSEELVFRFGKFKVQLPVEALVVRGIQHLPASDLMPAVSPLLGCLAVPDLGPFIL